MKNELIVKDNALINASYSLTLVEQRLILLAIIATRKEDKEMAWNFWLGTPIKVTADSYINTFGVDKTTAYKSLKMACKTLFSRQFSYQEPREKGIANKTTRWVSDIAYVDNTATVEFTFAPAVLPLITRLEKHFTSYELEQVSNLTSTYAIRLYELIIAWRAIGKVPTMNLQEFRAKLGVEEHEYKRMGQFKEKVLNLGIEQINQHTDILVEYEQYKNGRTITGFSFKFVQKQKLETKTIENLTENNSNTFIKLSEAQLDTFSSKLANLSEVQSMAYIGEDMKPFVARLRTMLMTEQDQQKLRPYLAQVGFVTR